MTIVSNHKLRQNNRYYYGTIVPNRYNNNMEKFGQNFGGVGPSRSNPFAEEKFDSETRIL